ncbi:HTH domain-containing protein [Sphingobium sp. CAP-1]|uniref:HTH domain-containing protein n=1 Tax=Sphingobium sp. CAP-1 TaxID=2676077 RepID=UPI0012BB24E8|nr:hypothetical protein [Sphingobium sp. CAP-1]QGP79398.1 hypothetical protein GL174_10685 [Sphingobium sp. CAP-1]
MVKVSRAASDEHEFHTLGSRPFEHFVRALHEAQLGILSTNLYGPDGQGQFGADHIAFRTEGAHSLEIGQSKAHRTFGPSDLRKAADAFLENWDDHWHAKDVKRFILFVGCVIKSRQAADEIITLTRRFADHGVEFVVWDASGIYDRLGAAPEVVRTHLGQDWYEKLFGEPVGPLTGLRRDLQRGDFAALNVAAFVGRLSQAESAEIKELRRRARRGETAAVIQEIEESCAFGPVAQATAPEVRADKLRLLAGLLIPGGDFERVKALLDEADALGGDSTRLRSVLTLEALGPAAALAYVPEDCEANLAEVRAVAQLRDYKPDAALAELQRHLDGGDPSAEILRIAALAKLMAGHADAAVDLARKAIAKDSDSRACRQALGISLFQMAVSPVAQIGAGEWPQPVDQPLVMTSDAARTALEEALSIFADLMEGQAADDTRAMLLWHFGVLACMPWRRAEAEARIAALEAEGELPPPAAAWAMSRGLPFDAEKADAVCAARTAENPDDFETLLIQVAVASYRRNLKQARALLEGGRTRLDEAGHASLYLYWSAVLDMEARRTPTEEALAAHPWLRLRVALDIRKRKPRLQMIGKVLEDAIAQDGDPRVMLAAAQFLLDGGWHNSAAKAAPALLERIGTGEAISLAAHALYRAGQYGDALTALDNVDAFPGKKLPVDLQRLRIECLAGAGEIVRARETSIEIARSTGVVADLWRSIEFQLASGAASAALAFYNEHAGKLSAPMPGHILLARAILHFDPDAAARITRHISADAPDHLVTAAFELASKLRLADEQRILMGRIQQLGIEGAAGVQLVSLDDVKAMIAERHEQVEQLLDQYRRGHTPVHTITHLRPAALAATYLGPLLRPPEPHERSLILSTRYGRRFEAEHWPADSADVVLFADVTALLTAHGLGILDKIERVFKPIRIATDTLPFLTTLRSDLEPIQPERIEAARRVLHAHDDGEIVDQSEVSQVDTFTVRWDVKGGEPSATLNFSQLFLSLIEGAEPAAVDALRLSLGNTLDPAPAGPTPPDASTVNLEPGIAVTLEECGALRALMRRFTITITCEDVEQMRAAVADAEAQVQLVDSLTGLIQQLSRGLDENIYQAVPVQRDGPQDPLRRASLQLMSALAKNGDGILWVDDRFLSSIEHDQFRVETTVEIIDALVRYERLTKSTAYGYRQKLRRARWMFMPIDGEEIAYFLRLAVKDAVLTESEDLGTLRRAVADMLLERRNLQWPTPHEAEQGARGEIPFLLDAGHAVTGALKAVWGSREWTIADAEVASAWLLEYLEIDLFPMPPLEADDPRSDHLIGIHLASLLLTVLQMLPAEAGKGKRKAYLEWLWNYLVRESLRVRPELRDSMEAMLEHHLTDVTDERIWLQFVGRTLNHFPIDLRMRLFDREAVRTAFDLPDHGQVSVDDHDFDEREFWSAIADAVPGVETRLTTTAGVDALIVLTGDDAQQQVTMTIGQTAMRLDAWPWRVGNDDLAIRRAALEERSDRFDLSPSELDALAEELGHSPMRAARVQTALRRSHESIGCWYADLRDAIERQKPVCFSKFAPDDVGKVARYLRLDEADADWCGSAARLIDDHGLAIAVRRLSGLPIPLPEPIATALRALDEHGLRRLLDDVGGDRASPWSQLLLARAILARADLPAELRERLSVWLTAPVVDPLKRSFWDLYTGLARFIASEGPSLAGWRELNGRQQLAVCWGHAAAAADAIIGGHVRADTLIAFLEDHRHISPRGLVEDLTRFAGDRADPQHMNADRLMLFSAAPGLLDAVNIAPTDSFREALAQLMLDEEDGAPQARLTCAQGGLVEEDRLGSVFSVDIGPGLDAVQKGAGTLFGNGLKDFLQTLLREPVGTSPQNAVWSILRLASNDGPLPADISGDALRIAQTLPLANPGSDIRDARRLLLSVTANAAANGWVDLTQIIDRAAEALGPDQGYTEEEAQLFFEIAIWRARLEPDRLTRTRKMAEDLQRLGREPETQAQAERIAVIFARSLSGQYSEAFVDALARFRACR